MPRWRERPPTVCSERATAGARPGQREDCRAISFLIDEADQVPPELLRIEACAEILYAHLPISIDEGGELRMLDRAVLLLREEYPITFCPAHSAAGRSSAPIMP